MSKVRKQVDPNRSSAAHKAWATRRKLHPEKFPTPPTRAATKKTLRRTPKEIKPIKDKEEIQPKWHVTSTAQLTTRVSYAKNQRISNFMDQPWVEKYRPVSLSDVIGPVVGYLKAYVRTGSVPLALIFHGPYGDGKTTSAKAFVRDFYVFRGLFKRSATFRDVAHASKVTKDYEGIFPPALYVDASLVKDTFRGLSGVDVIRTRVQNFMKYSVGIWAKFVIIDEADRLGFEAQGALSSLIERYPKTRTIYTTNYLNDMMDRIVSRAAGGVFEFVKPSPRSISARLRKIAKAEHVRIKNSKINEIAKTTPSVRDAIGKLQQECAVLMVVKQNGCRKK